MTNYTLILNIPLIIIGFFLLNRGAGMLIDGGASVARKFKLPESMIGFTIVALGAALPKFFTSIMAAMNGYNDLLLGSLIGSGIVNLLGIVGLVGLNRPIRSSRYTAFIGLPVGVLCTVLVYGLSNNQLIFSYDKTPMLSFKDGIFLLAAFVLFMTYAYFNVKRNHTVWFVEDKEKLQYYPMLFSIILVIVGILGLYAGALLVVDNLIDISRKYDLSQRFLGQCVLSVGGSLVMYWWTKNFQNNQTRFELSQLVGTNMLYLLGVLGVCAVIAPITFNAFYNIDLYILLGVNALMILLLITGKKLILQKWQCQLLLLLFVAYIVYLFVR
jgi:cation:H+ antiporter